MTEKKFKKKPLKDKTEEVKPIKGHRTRKHYLNAIKAEEAKKDILDTQHDGE
jgi:hypothetical protein